MDKTTHEVRIAHWKEIVRNCQARPEGMSAKDWLVQNDVNCKQYYYWLRLIRLEAYEEMKACPLPATQNVSQITFAEVPVPQKVPAQPSLPGFQPDAILCVNGVTVAVSNSASADLVSRIMEALNHAC